MESKMIDNTGKEQGIHNFHDETGKLLFTLGTDAPVELMSNEILRVTPDGKFLWNPHADQMIEEADFSNTPATKHILLALRKTTWSW